MGNKLLRLWVRFLLRFCYKTYKDRELRNFYVGKRLRSRQHVWLHFKPAHCWERED